QAATRLQIEAVRVGASARGLGRGTRRIEWAHQYGRERGARPVQLTTARDRTDARRFYEKLGHLASHRGFMLELCATERATADGAFSAAAPSGCARAGAWNPDRRRGWWSPLRLRARAPPAWRPSAPRRTERTGPRPSPRRCRSVRGC